MTSGQERRLSMYQVVRDYLLNNTTITATLPNFAAAFTLLQNGITQIQGIRQFQESNKGGVTLGKGALRQTLITLAADMATKLVAYATSVNNTALAVEVDYSESKLERCADNILYDRAKLIFDRGTTNLTGAGPFGVTTATLTTLQTTFTAYLTAIPKPRVSATDKKQATDQLKVLFKNTQEGLKKIDVLVNTLKNSQPMFFKEYWDTRKIVNTGRTKYYIKGKVIDTVTKQGLQGATMKITAKSGTSALKGKKGADFVEKKSTKKGRLTMKSLPEGSYSALVTKPGYKDLVLTLNVTENVMTEFVAELELK